MSNVIIRGGVGMLKEQILDVMFRQRCKDCKGFIFLLDYEVTDNQVSGTAECPECESHTHIYFVIDANEKRSTH